MADEWDSEQRDPQKEALKYMASEDSEKMTRQCAKFFRISYQALKAEGFSHQEAFEIILKRGPFLN